MAGRGIPDGYHTVTPFLYVKDGKRYIDFLKSAFGGRLQGEPMYEPDGRLAHAEVVIGDSPIMLTEAEGHPVKMYLYVEDADSQFRTAVEAGAKPAQEPRDEFWGDRVAAVEDGWGNTWFIATQKEQVSEEEIKRRMATARA